MIILIIRWERFSLLSKSIFLEKNWTMYSIRMKNSNRILMIWFKRIQTYNSKMKSYKFKIDKFKIKCKMNKIEM